jgi:hypothetical protein
MIIEKSKTEITISNITDFCKKRKPAMINRLSYQELIILSFCNFHFKKSLIIHADKRLLKEAVNVVNHYVVSIRIP